jgi:hypothetical protein
MPLGSRVIKPRLKSKKKVVQKKLPRDRLVAAENYEGYLGLGEKLFGLGVFKRVYLKGSKLKKGFFAKRGELIKIESNPRKGHSEYWNMLLIHELFPKNCPRPRGLEIVYSKEGIPLGYGLHMDKVVENRELKSARSISAEKGRAMNAIGELGPHSKLVKQAMDLPINKALLEDLKSWGITSKIDMGGNNLYDSGNMGNVSVADPNNPVFFEPKIIDKLKFIRKFRKTNFSQIRKKRIRKYLKRLKEAEKRKIEYV